MTETKKKLEKDQFGNYRYVSTIESTYSPAPRKKKSRIDQDNVGLTDMLGGPI